MQKCMHDRADKVCGFDDVILKNNFEALNLSVTASGFNCADLEKKTGPTQSQTEKKKLFK